MRTGAARAKLPQMLPRLIQTAFGAVATVWVAAYTPPQSRQYDVIIDEAFGAEDRQQIDASLESWRRVIPELRLYPHAGRCEDANNLPDLPHRVICVTRVGPEDLPDNILGFTVPGPRGAVVALPAGSTPDTIAHELGHAMGLSHASKCGTLMYPSRYHDGHRCDAMAPTPADVQAWHAVAR